MQRQVVITLSQDAHRWALREIYNSLSEIFDGSPLIESIDKYRIEGDLRPDAQ